MAVNMGFQPVVMSNYNNNNPMIILSKQQYDKIVDGIQSYSKGQIIRFIPLGIGILTMFVLEILQAVLFQKFPIVNTIALLIALICGLLWGNYLLRRFKLYMSNHPLMKSFNEISQLQMSEIANSGISTEDVLKALHGLYQLYGELISEINYTQIITMILVAGCWLYNILAYCLTFFGKVVI